MADTPIAGAQAAPAATTATDLYTAPAPATISSFVVCNRGSTETTFRIWKRELGVATADKQYLYYDTPIAANDTFKSTMGATMAATDVITVYAGNANLSFSAFGVAWT